MATKKRTTASTTPQTATQTSRRRSAPTSTSAPATPDANESTQQLNLLMKALKDDKQPEVRLFDLSQAGPVKLIRSTKGGPGILVHQAGRPDHLTLDAAGQGFSVSRDAARLLGTLLLEWAGPASEPKTVAQWFETNDDRWELAK